MSRAHRWSSASAGMPSQLSWCVAFGEVALVFKFSLNQSQQMLGCPARFLVRFFLGCHIGLQNLNQSQQILNAQPVFLVRCYRRGQISSHKEFRSTFLGFDPLVFELKGASKFAAPIAQLLRVRV